MYLTVLLNPLYPLNKHDILLTLRFFRQKPISENLTDKPLEVTEPEQKISLENDDIEAAADTEVLEEQPETVINKADDENLVLNPSSPNENEVTFKCRELVVRIEKIECVKSEEVASEKVNESVEEKPESCQPAETPVEEIPVVKDLAKRRISKKFLRDIKLQSKKIRPAETPKSTPRDYFCEVCCLKFTCFKRLWNHKKLVHHSHTFRCILCPKKFKNCSLLLAHSKSAHKKLTAKSKEKKGEPLFYCEACGLGFRNIQKRFAHVRAKHSGGYISCSLCEHSASSVAKLALHVKTHKLVKKSLFYCKVCKQDFYFLPVFVNHLRSHSNVASPKLFQCKKCSLKVEDFAKYVKHMEEHLFNNPKYVCLVCDKYFRSNAKLEWHLMHLHKEYFTSSSKGKHDCYWCGKILPKNRLKTHLKKHNKFTKKKLITCRICLKAVASSAYKFHLAKHLAKIKKSGLKKNFKKPKDEVEKPMHEVTNNKEPKPPPANVKKAQKPSKASDSNDKNPPQQPRRPWVPWKQYRLEKRQVSEGPRFMPPPMEGPPGVDFSGPPSFFQNRPNFRGPINNGPPPMRGNAPPMMMNNPPPRFGGNGPMMMNRMNAPMHPNEPMMMNPMNNCPPPHMRGNDPMMMNQPPPMCNDPMMMNQPPPMCNDPMMMNQPPPMCNDPMMMNHPMNNPLPPMGNDPMMMNPMHNGPPGYQQQNFGMFPQPSQPLMSQPMFRPPFGNEYGNQFPPMQPNMEAFGYMDSNQFGYQQFPPEMPQWPQSADVNQEPFNFRADPVCSGCQKTFGTPKVLAVHELFCLKLVDKLTKQKMHDCPVCSQKFNSLATVKQHLFQSHAQIFKEFNLFNQKASKNECKTCKQVFKTKEELAAHEMTHEFLASLKSDLEKVDVSSTLLGKSVAPARKSRFDQVTPIPKPSSAATSQTPSHQTKPAQETLKITQKVTPEGLQLEDINSPSYRMKLEQQKKKLKINILYYQKQKLEHEKQSGSREKSKTTENELKKIQKKLLDTQKSFDTRDTLRRSRSRSPIPRRIDHRRSRSHSRERRRFADRSPSPRRSFENTARWTDKRGHTSPFTKDKQTRKLNFKPGEELSAYKCHKCATLFSNYRDYITHKEMHENDSDDEENYLSQLEPETPRHQSEEQRPSSSRVNRSDSGYRQFEDYRSKYSGSSRNQPQSSQRHGGRSSTYIPPRDGRAKCHICHEDFPNRRELDYHVCPGPF